MNSVVFRKMLFFSRLDLGIGDTVLVIVFRLFLSLSRGQIHNNFNYKQFINYYHYYYYITSFYS